MAGLRLELPRAHQHDESENTPPPRLHSRSSLPSPTRNTAASPGGRKLKEACWSPKPGPLTSIRLGLREAFGLPPSPSERAQHAVPSDHLLRQVGPAHLLALFRGKLTAHCMHFHVSTTFKHAVAVP